MLRTTIVTFVLLAALTCPVMSQDKGTIQKLSDQFAETFNKGDTAGVAAFYTVDAYLLPPGAEMAKGRSAVQNFWKAAAEQVGTMRLTTMDVMPLGENAAQEIGSFTLRTKAQPPQEIAGKYVVIWRKVGADWKLATDIWNTNK
jgi:uncharacterized protein (TIGR02246 family)